MKYNITEVAKLYADGQSLSDLAKKFGVTKSALSYAFKAHSIITRQPPSIGTSITKDEILRLRSLGKSIVDISIRENVSTTVIRRILANNKKRKYVIGKHPQSSQNKVSKEKLIELVNSNLTDTQIGNILKFNRQTIHRLKKQYNIVKSEPINKNDLEKYINDGLTNNQIARITNCSTYKIKSLTKQYKIVKPEKYMDITPEVMSIICGIHLGDAHISKAYQNIKPHLEYGHSIAQGDVTRLVHHLLGDLTSNRKIVTKAPDKPGEDTFYRFRTISHPKFKEMRERYYIEKYFDGKEALKRIDGDLLNMMTDVSLSLFYIDDGFWTEHNNKTTVGFCTDRFLLEDIKLIQKYLKLKFDLDTTIHSKVPGLTTGHEIILLESSMEKFENIIEPYLIKCVRHKYPRQYKIPSWEINPNYMSTWDKIVENTNVLPPIRLPNIDRQYSKSSIINVGGEPIEYKVEQASVPEISNFLKEFHYKGRPINSRLHFKLTNNDKLMGAASFGMIRTLEQIKGIFNTPINRYEAMEVSRFACLDICKKNTESFFLSECIKAISVVAPQIKVLITYSQPEVGHYGYVYQATNWIYISSNAGAKIIYLLDEKPITRKTLKKYHGEHTGRNAWREIYKDRLKIIEPPSKHKYIFIIDNLLKDKLIIPYLPYPKKDI